MGEHDSGVAIARRIIREEQEQRAFAARLARDLAFVESFLRLGPRGRRQLERRRSYLLSTINCVSGNFLLRFRSEVS